MKAKTTYIDLINQFWTQSKECAFNPSDAVLYFFLLNTCNALHWKQPFGQSDRFLSLSLGFSVNTIRGAKNRLKQRGLIDFKVPEKNGRGIEGQTKYVILSVSKFDIVPDIDADIVPDIDADIDADIVPDNNIRQDKIRQDKESKIKNFTKKDFRQSLLDFGVEEQYICDWFAVRDKAKAPYTQTALNALINECNKNNFSIAEAVRHCAENGWRGFKVKWVNNLENFNGKNNSNSTILEF